MDTIALSKQISYALRHAPHEYGLQLDEQGWTSVDALLSALRKQQQFSELALCDIEKMIQASEKKRVEIRGNRIRALYGHSSPNRVEKVPIKPPAVLYHGTARRFAESILASGLVSKSRQYVHLSEDVNTAIVVGQRRDKKPIVYQVDAAQAWADGIAFYLGNEDIWLAEDIPAKYITIT